MGAEKVLATVNNKEIKEQDVVEFLNQLDPQTAAQFRTPEGMNQIANELVGQELLYLDALENDLDKEKSFLEELEKVKKASLKQYAINKLFSEILIEEEDIKDFYDKNPQYFQKPESAQASHILVDTEEEAEQILEEIQEGLSFEDAAKGHSSCPSKENGGNLGEFQRGKMVPEFEEVAFAMEEGTISEPVETQFGYHLIKLISKTQASTSPIEEVKGQIQQQLQMMKQQEKYLNKVEELKKDHEVETFF